MSLATVVDNKFTGGLKTEFTGLNFPDDSCSETFNCIFNRTGLIERRLGFDYETGYTLNPTDRTSKAMSTYYWRNVIGDGEVSLCVTQVGSTIYFFRNSSATLTSPLSSQLLVSTVSLLDFDTSTFDVSVECQYADGNGYLFIFHPNMDPVVCTYSGGTVTGMTIDVKIRDTEGVLEIGVDDTFRPTTLSANHQYNLQNQGWAPFATADSWSATSTTSNTGALGTHTWTVQSGLTITAGQIVTITTGTTAHLGTFTMSGTVTSYSGSTLILSITSSTAPTLTFTSWTFSSGGSATSGYIFDWFTAIANYPANADIWWRFKNASNVFDPATTITAVTLNAGPAPKGFYILSAFNQLRSLLSGVAGVADVTTGGIRPSTGTFFAGRVWYSGVNYQGFNEKLYFSQIIENSSQFGRCYQSNDLTSEDAADLIASDGGYISIPGSGTIFKLFPIVNGLLIFAERGVWFLTGSQGIGFTANDYTIVPLSPIPTISANSFVNVQGFPMWWNEDGIYSVSPQKPGVEDLFQKQQSGLTVVPITYGTIASFYQDIPLKSKYYAKGYFNNLEYKVEWLYKDTTEVSVTDRYNYSNILNLDTITNAFYPWSISPSNAKIIGIIALGGKGNLTSALYTTKYLTSVNNTSLTFSEVINDNYLDWSSIGDNTNYSSYLVTGYRVYTKGNVLGQLPYIDIQAVGNNTQVDLQTRWDYTTSGNTGRWSSIQRIEFVDPDRAYQTKRRRTRGQGRAVQLKLSSVSGQPMSLTGWSTLLNINTGP